MFLRNLSSIQVHQQSIIDIHTCAHNRSKVKNKTESKQLKQKELKRQKQNKEQCFAKLKRRETHSGATSPSLGDCTALEKDLVALGKVLAHGKLQL
jgi:hypothetical protein